MIMSELVTCVNLVLIIIGWYVVYIFSKRISKRAEAFAILQSFDKNLAELTHLSFLFWSGGQSNHLEHLNNVGAHISLSRSLLEQYVAISGFDKESFELFSIRPELTEDAERKAGLATHAQIGAQGC